MRISSTQLPAASAFTDATWVTPRSSRPSSSKPRLHAGLEEAVVLALFDLTNHLQRRGERLAAVAGLTTQQWLVLLQIAGDPNFPASARHADDRVLASDIARVRGVSRATVSAVISALKTRGLIREDPDPDDRRRRYLAITRQGAAAIDAIEGPRRLANQTLLRDLDRADRRRLLDYLERCLAVLWALVEDEHVAAARRRHSKPARVSARQ